MKRISAWASVKKWIGGVWALRWWARLENGRDALELAEALQPDVVLTDIKMPFMDGAGAVRDIDPAAAGVQIRGVFRL